MITQRSEKNSLWYIFFVDGRIETTNTMAYVFHANGILTGAINCFCLACDSYLTCQREAKDHITQTSHKKKLSEVLYEERFKGDRIRKFSSGYFCEFCNLLLPIATKVNLHISEEGHKHNKGTLSFKLMGRDVIAYNDVRIEEKAWHGLTEGICSLCNAEFDDEDDHKKDTRHCLNLVLKPIKFGEDFAIYREIDASAVQCLTCNKLLAPMSKHFIEDEHVLKYAQCRIKTNGLNKSEQNVDDSENEILKSDNEPSKDKTKILDSINIFHSKGININLESETAYCRKCSIVIQFTFTDIEGHIAKHSTVGNNDSEHKYPSEINHSLNRVNINDKTSESKDDVSDTEGQIIHIDEKIDNGTFLSRDNSSTDDEESTEQESCFANENSITYVEGKSVALCRICEVQLPSSLKSMKEHVTGAAHKKATQKTTTKPQNSCLKLTKEPSNDFIESVCTIRGPFYVDTVINEKYCVPQLSYLLISKNNNMKLRCILCKMNLPPFCDLKVHCKSDYHLKKFLAVPVITSKPDEFIREIRDDLYHCGFCNELVSGWGQMNMHLVSSDHKTKKQRAEDRLESHLPDMRRHEFVQHMQQMEFLRLLFMLNQ